MPELAALLRGATVTMTCVACPAQWEGTLEDGRCVYVRYRGGWLSVGIGATSYEAIDDDDTFGTQIGDHYDGTIDWTGVLKAVESSG